MIDSIQYPRSVALAGMLAVLSPCAPLAAEARPRTIVTTDMETDDYDSMIRLLLYTNEIDVAGLVYSSSEYHWAGDGKGTMVAAPDRKLRTSWRWTGTGGIAELLDAYARVFPNLRRHQRGYPAPDTLRRRVKIGNIAFEGDMAADTEGSDWIRAALLDGRPGPLFLQAWGGMNTIARALKSIEERYRRTPRWAGIYRKVSRKAVIYTWGKQDKTYDSYIAVNWPDVQVNDISKNAWGYRTLGPESDNVLPEDRVYFEPAWTRDHVLAAGALGAKYRVWGDGRTFAGDPADTFGMTPYPGRPLRRSSPPGSFISEGDTPAFLNLIVNGLRAYQNPGYGGWGNRLVRAPESRANLWTTAETEADGAGRIVPNYTSKRWVSAAQRDFAARLAWSATPTYAAANHPPVVTVRSGLALTVRPGQRVTLAGRAKDPDGDAMTCRWWHYADAGTYPGRVDIRNADRTTASFTVPADATAGQTLHLILEVTDGGSPAMTRYARVIATVRPR